MKKYFFCAFFITTFGLTLPIFSSYDVNASATLNGTPLSVTQKDIQTWVNELRERNGIPDFSNEYRIDC